MSSDAFESLTRLQRARMFVQHLLHEIAKGVQGLSQYQPSDKEQIQLAEETISLMVINSGLQDPRVKPCYLTPEIHRRLQPSVAQYPEHGCTLTDSLLWEPCGWIYCPAPFGIVKFYDGAHADIPIHSLLWHRITAKRRDEPTHEAVYFHGLDIENAPIIHGAFDLNEMICRQDTAPRQSVDQTGYRDEMWQLIQWILTLNVWLQQKLLVSSPAQPSRQLRRAADRHQRPLEAVQVITMRARELVASTSSESRSVDWQWQWLVQGHWRRQWHPSTRTHEVMWIEPYLKGPDDKPLKPSLLKLFRLSR